MATRDQDQKETLGYTTEFALSKLHDEIKSLLQKYEDRKLSGERYIIVYVESFN